MRPIWNAPSLRHKRPYTGEYTSWGSQSRDLYMIVCILRIPLRFTSRGERIYLERETHVCSFGAGDFIPIAFCLYTITTRRGDCPTCGCHLVNNARLHRSSPDGRSTLSPPGKHLARNVGDTAPGILPADTSTARLQVAKTRDRVLCRLRGDWRRPV